MEKFTAQELDEYLAEQDIDATTRELLRAEEIDGIAFLDLTEDDFKEMKIKIGPKRRLLKLIKEENTENTDSTLLLPEYDRPEVLSPLPKSTINKSPTSTVHSPQSTSSNSAVPMDIEESTVPFSKNTVREILMKHSQGGENFVKGLEKGKSDKVKMVQILVGELVFHHGNPYPPDKAKLALAKAIVKEFPILSDTFDSKLEGHERFFNAPTRRGSIEYRLWQIRKGLPLDQKKYKPKQTTDSTNRQKLSSCIREEDLPLLSQEKHEEEVASMHLRTPNQDNKTAITSSLAITIGNRRRFIRDKSPSITKILETYPRLRDFEGDMIRREFNLLFEYKDYLGHFSRFYVPKILRLAKNRVPSAVSKMEDITTDEHFIALAVIPQLLPQANFSKNSNKGAKKAKLSEDATDKPDTATNDKADSSAPNCRLVVPHRELLQILEMDGRVHDRNVFVWRRA